MKKTSINPMASILMSSLLSAFLLGAAGCDGRESLAVNPGAMPGSPQTESEDKPDAPGQVSQYVSIIFVESSDGTDDGVNRLLRSMQNRGIEFYQTQASPEGLIASGDVVLLKINCQWAERGGTNTDLIRAIIQAILNHPGGFTGEIIIADNGQAQFGSNGNGGSLDWANANSADRRQSVMQVVRYFQQRGNRVTGVLWDEFTGVQVREFSGGDMRDGYVVEGPARSTGLEISYPKFSTEYGTRVSFKEGIWNDSAGTYDSERLKIINVPVLKSHRGFQVTGAVKNYMGVPSDRLTARRSHNSVGLGGMGTLMAETRIPVLNILDMIWIAPDGGPRSLYSTAVQINKIAASTDPVALDYWASKNILMPEAAKLPAGRATSMNPDATEPGTFGYWLRLSMNELRKAGISTTMTESEILVVGGGS